MWIDSIDKNVSCNKFTKYVNYRESAEGTQNDEKYRQEASPQLCRHSLPQQQTEVSGQVRSPSVGHSPDGETKSLRCAE